MKFAIRIALAVAVALTLAGPLAAFASEPDLYRPTPTAELFEKAVKLGGFEAECGKRHNGCVAPAVLVTEMREGLMGSFTWDEPRVVKLNSVMVPGSLKFNSVLVHEFTHYLQWLTGKIGPHNWCPVAVEMETQAYNVAAAYIGEFGVVRDYTENIAIVRMNVMYAQLMGGC